MHFPDCKEIIKEGYNAYLDDKKLDDNPYDEELESNEYNLWMEGWYDAAWDD